MSMFQMELFCSSLNFKFLVLWALRLNLLSSLWDQTLSGLVDAALREQTNFLWLGQLQNLYIGLILYLDAALN